MRYVRALTALARRIGLAMRLHADPVLRYGWLHAWRRAGEI